MQPRARRLRGAAAALAATALVVIGPGVAVADDDGPVRGVVGSLTKELGQEQAKPSGGPSGGDAGTSANLGVPSQPAPEPPNSDDDLPGHETENPEPPDHGGAQVADVDLLEEDAVDISDNESTVEDDDSTKADSTLLALGGMEVLGAHADSSAEKESHAGDPLAPLCEGSGGALCLRILYSDAYADETGTTSSSSSESGIAELCVAGSSSEQRDECDGALGVEVADSEAEAQRNKATGRTTAMSFSDVFNLCIQEPQATQCEVGLQLLHSEGAADSGGASSSAGRESTVAKLELAGTEVFDIDDPEAFAVPPDCPDPSLVCLFGNQGETYLGDGVAGHAQEALHFDFLKGLRLGEMTGTVLRVELSSTETLVHNDGGGDGPGESGSEGGQGPGAGASGGPGTPGAATPAAVGGILPNTGGIWSGLIALALLSISAGAFSMVRGRRMASA